MTSRLFRSVDSVLIIAVCGWLLLTPSIAWAEGAAASSVSTAGGVKPPKAMTAQQQAEDRAWRATYQAWISQRGAEVQAFATTVMKLPISGQVQQKSTWCVPASSATMLTTWHIAGR